MCEPDIFQACQPLSPIVSVDMATYTSTPTTSLSGTSALQTPLKSIGCLYYGEEYKTPSSSLAGWAGLKQSSPCVRTPGSSSGNRARIMSRSHTPSSKCSSKKGTPQMHTTDQPYNPFDSNILEQLEGSLFSPNVFTGGKSAQQTPKSFQWTIDELAILKPADIEELPNQPSAIPTQPDSDLERRAQEVIDAYFANNLIAPSPWSDSGAKKNFVLPETPKTPASVSSIDSPLTFGDRKTTAAKKTESNVCDAACQTVLTLPVNFNIENVLGEYCTYKNGRNTVDSSTQEILSMSSLRRKLFFHGEEGSPPSPVRPSEYVGGGSMDYDGSPILSPVKQIHDTPKQSHYKPPETPSPGSAQFSSSPISLSRCGNSLTPFLRRCSTAPELIESPDFSPIISSSSPHVHATPMCHQLQATPGSGQVMHPLDSPGMSPIVQHNGNFTPEHNSKQRMFMLRSHPEKVQIPLELRPSPDCENANDDSLFQGMDVEGSASQPCSNDLSFVSSQEDQFTKARFHSSGDTQYSDDEGSNQETCQIYYVSQGSQDTGYNTNSLQLTNNQDPGLQVTASTMNETSLHTNLTQHFVNLPFSSQDGLCSDGSSATFAKQLSKKPFIRHLAAKASNNGQMGCSVVRDNDICLNEREVRRKAKRILGKSISMDDSQLGMSLESSMLRPCLLNTIGVPAFVMSSPSSRRQPYTSDGKILPSELASCVLQKAGEDFRKYCDEEVKNNYNKHQQDLDNDFQLNQMDYENHPNLNISMSAEF